MKALDEYIVMVLFMVLMKRVHFVAFFKTYLDRETLKVWLRHCFMKASKLLELNFACLVKQNFTNA